MGDHLIVGEMTLTQEEKLDALVGVVADLTNALGWLLSDCPDAAEEHRRAARARLREILDGSPEKHGQRTDGVPLRKTRSGRYEAVGTLDGCTCAACIEERGRRV